MLISRRFSPAYQCGSSRQRSFGVSSSTAPVGSRVNMVAYDENGFLGGLIQEWIEAHRKSYGPVFVLAQELNRECHRFLDGRGWTRKASCK